MKVIWFIVCVLVLTAVFVLIDFDSAEPADSPDPADRGDAQRVAMNDDTSSSSITPDSADADAGDSGDSDVDASDAATSDADVDSTDQDSKQAGTDSSAATAGGDSVGSASDEASASTSNDDQVNDKSQDDQSTGAGAFQASDAEAMEKWLAGETNVDAGVDGFVVGGGHDPASLAALREKADAALKGAGSADGPLKGSGTREDPYQITWDLLLRASQTYDPKKDMREIPEKIQLLHEKHVSVTGYILAPLGMDQVEEVLLMMNMWDGCCIGVPPSAYDAVEVAFDGPAKIDTRVSITFGTIQGILKIDPYEVSNWLVGLYITDAAKLTEQM